MTKVLIRFGHSGENYKKAFDIGNPVDGHFVIKQSTAVKTDDLAPFGLLPKSESSIFMNKQMFEMYRRGCIPPLS